MKDFIYFLKTGKTSIKKNYFQDLVVLFLLLFIVNFVFASLKLYLYNEPFLGAGDMELLKPQKLLMFVVFIPLVEEILFRGILNIRKSNWIVYVIGLGMIFLVLSYIKGYFSLVGIGVILLFSFFYNRKSTFRKSIKNFISNNYLLLVYVSSILFGLAHITNYDTIEFKTFLSTLNRILGGLYFAYLVTKYNFWANSLMHIANNGLAFLLGYLMLQFM